MPSATQLTASTPTVSTSSDSGDNGRLSAGATAGVVIGSAVVLVLIIAGMKYLFLPQPAASKTESLAEDATVEVPNASMS